MSPPSFGVHPGARLVALDVDGTLLTSAGTLTPRTRDALHAAEAAGWHVVLVTGRPVSVASPVVQELGIGEYLVASNGATVAHLSSGSVVYQATLPGAAVAATIRRARLAMADLSCAVTTARGFVHELGFATIAPPSETEGRRVIDAAPEADDEVHSAVLFVLGVDTRVVLAQVAAAAVDGVTVSPSGLPGAVELTGPGVHKGSGLARLCDLVDVDRRGVVAFGDGLNDREMLQWAGLGVAMGNAEPEIKAISDEVTASNDEEGVAIVMERLLRGALPS